MITLAIIAKNEENTLPRLLLSARSLVERIVVVDTGSTDDTVEVARGWGAEVSRRKWRGSAHARTEAMKLAMGEGWILMVDADMTIEAHSNLGKWLAGHLVEGEPDPRVEAWAVTIEDKGWTWRLPWLVRADMEWRFEGETHPYLVGGVRRPLQGLKLVHHGGYDDPTKFERDLEVLERGVVVDDPRSVYYTGWALRALGRKDEAAAMFDRRASLNGWDEERWHAAYMAAWLREDVGALMEVHRQRPHRHEPLSRAAAIVKARGTTDQLFLES